jgi:hypothetical protein
MIKNHPMNNFRKDKQTEIISKSILASILRNSRSHSDISVVFDSRLLSLSSSDFSMSFL